MHVNGIQRHPQCRPAGGLAGFETRRQRTTLHSVAALPTQPTKGHAERAKVLYINYFYFFLGSLSFGAFVVSGSIGSGCNTGLPGLLFFIFIGLGAPEPFGRPLFAGDSVKGFNFFKALPPVALWCISWRSGMPRHGNC